MKIAIAAVLLVLASGSARADVDADRHKQLAKLKTGVFDFCKAVDGWKIASLAGAEAAKDKAAGAKVDDSDMGNWDGAQKNVVRSRIRDIKGACSLLKDPESGLPALVKKTTKLDGIAQDVWEPFTEGLEGVLESYSGYNNAPKHYGNRYGGKPKPDAIFQLTSDATPALAKSLGALERTRKSPEAKK